MFDPRMETMPRPELEALKLERLKHIVRYCYETYPSTIGALMPSA